MAIFLWRANVMLSSDSARPNRSTMVLEQATPPVPQGILCADRRNCVNSTVVVLFPLLFVFYSFDVGPFITDAVIDAAFLSAAAIGTGAKKKTRHLGRDGEALVGVAAVRLAFGQHVVAIAVEVEGAAVEGLVVRLAPVGAQSGTGVRRAHPLAGLACAVRV